MLDYNFQAGTEGTVISIKQIMCDCFRYIGYSLAASPVQLF